jgi:hypothetical protein
MAKNFAGFVTRRGVGRESPGTSGQVCRLSPGRLPPELSPSRRRIGRQITLGMSTAGGFGGAADERQESNGHAHELTGSEVTGMDLRGGDERRGFGAACHVTMTGMRVKAACTAGR